MCLSSLQCTNVTSPPVLKLCDSQGYLWLPCVLTEAINLIGVTSRQKKFFKKVLYVIPSVLLSFFPYYCHSFHINVIPSELLSFLQDYCHSFRIIVICHSEYFLYPPISEGWENRPAEPSRTYLQVSFNFWHIIIVQINKDSFVHSF